MSGVGRSVRVRVANEAAFLTVFVAAFITAACGGAPPDKEMQQAQDAIEGARAAGADGYAKEEFVAAEQALTSAREAVAQRDYRLALNDALDSRERALDSREHALAAGRQTGEMARTTRSDAEHAMTAATAAMTNAAGRIKLAEAAHVVGRTLAPVRRAVADCETALQKARARFNAGDYRAVLDTLPASTAGLGRAVRDLEAATASAFRHRS